MAIRVGDIGRALSTMCPSGAVDVNGERVDARSSEGVIDVGSLVVILRGDPTGYVVRRLEPGQSPPHLPNKGEEIPKAEFQRNQTDVAEADRRERAEARREQIKRLQYGSIAAGSLGAVVGLISSGAAWCFGWAGDTEASGLALLLGGALVAGVVAGVILFFLTGLLRLILGLMQEGEGEFTPSILATFTGLVGTAIGFWWQFARGDPGTIALWSACGATGFVFATSLLSWVVGNILLSDGNG
jgi:hypothetical protein